MTRTIIIVVIIVLISLAIFASSLFLDEPVDQVDQIIAEDMQALILRGENAQMVEEATTTATSSNNLE